ncbi:MAG: LytTR family DNA-binding domain-containing protein [Spirochaetota bacterium]|nr:LytTR family DNA-binding domain-containing protein [Spirochaetota bacterium]
MINIMIVDDEKPARDELEFLLKKIPDVTISGTAEDGQEALELINKSMPDLIFLDIKMPEMNGFEVAEKLQLNNNTPGIIFTTAYDKYAIKAFEINALDYILKPFSRERLEVSIERYKSQQELITDINFESMEKLFQKLQNKDVSLTHISILQGEHFKPILIDDIVAVAADGRDVKILTTAGDFHHSKSISYMEDLLDSEIFFRCHRGYIININHIKKIDIWFNNTYQLEMVHTTEKIPVSRTYISQFREIMAIS